MARPTSKTELLEASQINFDKLQALIASLSPTEQEATFAFEDRDLCIRDVLIHLYEWHNLLLSFIRRNLKGENAHFLPAPYTWKTYPDMNVEFWKKHQGTSLSESFDLLNTSHSEVMNLLETFSDDELFVKKYFSWTGTTSLGAYCISSTSSHYDWAMKKIRKHKRSLKK